MKEIMDFVNKFSYEEINKKELKKYKEKVEEYKKFSEDEINWQYIKINTRYEQKN